MSTIRSVLDDKGWTVHGVGGDATVFEAVSRMCGGRIGALLVNDNGKPIGIVSERDIMRRVVLERRDPSRSVRYTSMFQALPPAKGTATQLPRTAGRP
jgi:CBS domain-containing protein